MSLDFDFLRETNVRRCEAAYRKVDDWAPVDWGCALAGEVGEACNFIKKLRSFEGTPEDTIELREEFRCNIAKELADVITYADLLAARLRIDLGEAVREKFNEVSRRKGVEIYL